MNEIEKHFDRKDIIDSIVNAIAFGDNPHPIEGIFLNNPFIKINDYAFEILVCSVQREKFKIANYIIDTIGNVNKIGVNQTNYKNLVNNKKGLEFLKVEVFKDSISNF